MPNLKIAQGEARARVRMMEVVLSCAVVLAGTACSREVEGFVSNPCDVFVKAKVGSAFLTLPPDSRTPVEFTGTETNITTLLSDVQIPIPRSMWEGSVDPETRTVAIPVGECTDALEARPVVAARRAARKRLASLKPDLEKALQRYAHPTGAITSVQAVMATPRALFETFGIDVYPSDAFALDRVVLVQMIGPNDCDDCSPGAPSTGEATWFVEPLTDPSQKPVNWGLLPAPIDLLRVGEVVELDRDAVG